MGSLGIWELIVIFVVALLVFGPKKLPELGKSLGKGLKEFKKATDDLKSNWDEQIKDVERSVDEVKSTVTSATDDIKRQIDATDAIYAEYDSPLPPAEPEPEAKAEDTAKKDEESKKEVHQA